MTVVRGYEGQKRYVEAAAGHDADGRAELFERLVTRPYQNCAQDTGGETPSLSESRLTTPVTDLATLAKTIETPRISCGRADTIRPVFAHVSSQPTHPRRPQPATTVCIADGQKGTDSAT